VSWSARAASLRFVPSHQQPFLDVGRAVLAAQRLKIGGSLQPLSGSATAVLIFSHLTHKNIHCKVILKEGDSAGLSRMPIKARHSIMDLTLSSIHNKVFKEVAPPCG
jgi:hypothetical protein